MLRFTRKRIIGYSLAAVFFSIACWAGAGIVSDLREWIWLRNAVEAKADMIGYEHEFVSTSRGTQRRTTFSYQYSMAGKRYSQSTRHLGPFINDDVEAERIIDSIERGQPVSCYVHAERPNEAILSRNASVGRFLMSVAFMFGFVVAGICILVGCVSKRYAHQFE